MKQDKHCTSYEIEPRASQRSLNPNRKQKNEMVIFSTIFEIVDCLIEGFGNDHI